MTVACACGVADFFAWASGILGVVGSLLLIRPLFLLLKHREVLDDMAYGLDYDLLSAELAQKVKVARKVIAGKLREQRFAWKPWVGAGAVALGLSLACALVQGWCLYAAKFF
ncbi:MAG: hypothetical protein ACREQH_15335 [Candidatus Binatus sp.]